MCESVIAAFLNDSNSIFFSSRIRPFQFTLLRFLSSFSITAVRSELRTPGVSSLPSSVSHWSVDIRPRGRDGDCLQGAMFLACKAMLEHEAYCICRRIAPRRQRAPNQISCSAVIAFCESFDRPGRIVPSTLIWKSFKNINV